MKNKLKRTIMEKTNWIEKVKEAIHIAMNKGISLSAYENEDFSCTFSIDNKMDITFYDDCKIYIRTPRGRFYSDYTLTDRDKLEIKGLVLSVKEYKEDMAISEFNEFISKKENKIVDINDLYDE